MGNADELMREGFALHQQERLDEAERVYLRILDLAPGYADAHYLLGCIAQQRGDYPAAVERVSEAIRHNDREPAFHRTLAQCYGAGQQWEAAAACYEKALQLAPDVAADWNELGFILREQGDLEGAGRCFEQCLAREPGFASALNNLANMRRDTGDIDESLALFRRARDADPANPDYASNYLFTLNMSTAHSREDICRAHFAYDERFGSGRHGLPVCPTRDPDPARPLRVAYFSPDLRSHPVSAFMAPVLGGHDRSQFHVSCYYLFPWEDTVSERLKGLSDRWVACGGADDEAVAAQIREDGIDILVDLAGHTGWNRLPVLALKPAPVIATWLGYLNTTGLRAVDYRITDAFSDPPGAERFYRERLVRLPEGHSCFESPGLPIAPNPLPAMTRGHVRFGSFNKVSKLTDTMLRTWARVLAAVPRSTLLIVGVGETMRERLLAPLLAEGIDRSRIEMRGRLDLQRMLAAHQEVDIAFDTFPYVGTTTTFNSLWMGVPTVTLAGEGAISRSSGSVLAALGLGDWVADSPEAYADIAARQARNVPALAALRVALRARLEQSSLMNAARFTRQLEAAYRDMWRTHCAAVST